jgi:hypothetical protein
MADPVSAGVMIGSQVVGNIAGAKAKAAQEAAQNAAKMANYRMQQNKEAMAVDRQNEKLMDQLYATMRANDFIESQSFDELLSNAKNVEDTSRQRRKDLSQQAEMVRVKNEENAMTRGLSPESANVQRVQRMQTKQEIKALNDVERDRSTQISNLLQRREGQLAQRGSEMIVGNTFQRGRAPDLFDNSSTYMTGALISSVGSIAGGIYGYGKYS